MSRRTDVVGLDDLFAAAGSPAGDSAAGWLGRSGWRWLLGRVFFAVAVGTVIDGFLWVIRVGVPYALIVATIFVVSVLRGALARIAAEPMPDNVTGRGLTPPTERERAAEIAPDDARTPDGMRIAVGRWDSRLNYPPKDSDRFARLVLPRLRELADERLRLRYGFTMATDPARARRMMGEDVWMMFHGSAPRGGIPPQDLAALVDRMEAL